MNAELPRRNPVQIVLNSANYISLKEERDHSNNIDFFGDNDDEFIEHKKKLIAQIKSIGGAIEGSRYGKSVFAKVKLREKAWAKSHRPTRSVFVPQFFPSAGVDGLGEPIFEVPLEKIPDLAQVISSAENETRKRPRLNSGGTEYHPSRERSEVGAIEEIILPVESDRRAFSTKEAIEWFSTAGSGRFYIVEIFNLPGSISGLFNASEGLQSLFKSLLEALNGLPFGVAVFRSAFSGATAFSHVYMRPVVTKHELTPADFFVQWNSALGGLKFDAAQEHHDVLLRLLSRHPLVRRVSLPPIIQSAPPTKSSADSQSAALPKKDAKTRYPKVGIIDSGIASRYKDWILEKHDFLAAAHREEGHGTFISGLLVAARAAGNKEGVAQETDGCELFDLDVLPDYRNEQAFDDYFPNGFEDFLSELDLAIAKAKQRFQVRIYNLSLNVKVAVARNRYGDIARLIDVIAEKHDVIIVISAGNLEQGKYRPHWPAAPDRVAAYLLPFAAADALWQPAESVYSISVSAINPPDVKNHLHGAPAAYCRRGPGMDVGVKPDFCHYGGAAERDTGLYSIDASGHIVPGMGTSYATPLLAKTLASVESKVQWYMPREALIALLIHKSAVPLVLAPEELRTIARNFVGFGMPPSADTILLTEGNSITMVFSGVLSDRRELEFPFSWPRSLVSAGGKCHGTAALTLVYKPILDSAFGAEFVRVNLNAFLRQNTDKGFRNQAEQIFMKGRKKDANFEARLIREGLKWWPAKHYLFTSKKNGTGESSDWKLAIDPLARDGGFFPVAGVPFTAILTITDPNKANALFDEMRLWLTTNGVQCGDIHTTAQIRATPRG